jgi:AraC family cel operon transcriptional repressor
MTQIRWQSLAPRPDGCHVARSHYAPNRSMGSHGHDFAEICWIEAGELIHDSPQRRDRLTPGGVVLIRPEHHHGLRAGPHGTRLVNIAISAGMLASLEARYGGKAWPWFPSADGGPQVRQLSTADLTAIGRRFDTFARGGEDPLARDAFLCDLLQRLCPRDHENPWNAAPPWLAQALAHCAEPPLLAEGLPALVRLTGRSREHVSRVLRQTCGLSPSAALRELRLRHAERELSLGQSTVGAIAASCGYANRSRFTRLFEQRWGCSPGAYRRRARLASG